MKRSEINRHITAAMEFWGDLAFSFRHAPPFPWMIGGAVQP